MGGKRPYKFKYENSKPVRMKILIVVVVAVLLLSINMVGSAGAQTDTSCVELADVTEWDGKINWSYMHSGRDFGTSTDEVYEWNILQSADVSFKLKRPYYIGLGYIDDPILVDGSATGILNINDFEKHYDKVGSFSETYTTKGSDSPSPNTGFIVRLNVNSTKCEYVFWFGSDINALDSKNNAGSLRLVHLGAGRSGLYPIRGTILSGSSDFPAMSLAMSGSDYSDMTSDTRAFYAPEDGQFYQAAKFKHDLGSATVTWEFTPKNKCNYPNIPTPLGVDIDKNIEEAKNHWNPFWFYNQVRNKGPWDYKQYGWSENPGQGSQYQDFGNFNYGATGTTVGFPEEVLLRMAGWAQMRANTSKPEYGVPWGEAPFGDDPDDQEMIKKGIEYAKCLGVGYWMKLPHILTPK